MASAASSASFLSRSARSTLTVSLTSWKVTSVAPSGSGMVVMSIIMPSRRSMRATIGSRLSIAVTASRKLRHTVLSSCIACAHAVIAAEHRDRFGQVIERLALHLDQRVVAAVHGEALGDVVVKISDAALRIGRGDHAQRAAVRQVPHLLLRLDRAIGLVKLLLPQPEVLLLG